jgi:hypothetical protein
MTGCWRLLTVFAPIVALTLVGPTVLVGQDITVYRSPAPAADQAVSPPPAQNASRSDDSSSTAPAWIPPPSFPRRNSGNVFENLVRRAGIIFSGRVISIGRGWDAAGGGPAPTTITFLVERGLRGAWRGQRLTIHEWGGLWAGGQRYNVGERLLLFLYSPSKLGLTSSVADRLGRFAIDSEGGIVVSEQQLAILAGDPILRGRRIVTYSDFVLAVHRAARQE